MKRKIAAFAAAATALVLLAPGRDASAQTLVPEGYEMVDSLVYIPVSSVDTTLAGKDVFSVLPSRMRGDAADVKVNQSDSVEFFMRNHVGANRSRTLTGYRVRIFFDNRQNSRTASEATIEAFRRRHPEIPAYRSYSNPYFKVTVGDLRTRSEALQLLGTLKAEYPSAFIVKEKISLPPADREHPYVVDTLHIIRPVQPLQDSPSISI